jgi:hypothetical protein
VSCSFSADLLRVCSPAFSERLNPFVTRDCSGFAAHESNDSSIGRRDLGFLAKEGSPRRIPTTPESNVASVSREVFAYLAEFLASSE